MEEYMKQLNWNEKLKNCSEIAHLTICETRTPERVIEKQLSVRIAMASLGLNEAS